MDEISLEQQLAADVFVYEFLHAAFGVEPRREHRAFFAGAQFQGLFAELAALSDGAEGGACFTRIARFLRDLGEKEAAELESADPNRIEQLISGEYTRLFVGPGSPVAAPWSSVHRSEGRTVFNEYTLMVRSFYRSAGFLPSQYPRVADDHIAIMMDFLARLSSRALEALESGDEELYGKTLATRDDFITSCVTPWVGKFVDAVQESSTHYFYPQVAEFLGAFMALKAR